MKTVIPILLVMLCNPVFASPVLTIDELLPKNISILEKKIASGVDLTKSVSKTLPIPFRDCDIPR